MSEQKKKKKSATERPARDLAAEAQQVLDAFGAGVREDAITRLYTWRLPWPSE